MAASLPARPSLDWLKKTAKQSLRTRRTCIPASKLADAQLDLARHYGFSSWRRLKAHIEQLQSASLHIAALEDGAVCEFFSQIGGGELARVRQSLIEHPELINAIGPHPYWGGRPQALHVAVETNRRDMFDLLVEAGANIDGNNEDYLGWSPLSISIQRKQDDMREALLGRGARIGLMEALLMADDALVEKFLRRGVAALPKQHPNDGSILSLARTPYAIDRLLKLGVSRDKQDRWGSTPIEAMSRLGPSGQALVRHMMSRGVAAEPEEYAHLGDQPTLAKLVRANPSIVKSAPVFVGAVGFSHYDLVQWLLDQGADVNVPLEKESGQTALHSAAWNGDMRMVKLLIAAGANIHALDRQYSGKPSGWAEIAIDVTNNPGCKEIVNYLRALESSAPGPMSIGTQAQRNDI